MKIAIFHELQELSGARKMVDEYGKILSKEHTIDLYYVDGKEDKDINNYFTNVYFFKFLEIKWFGNNWKLRFNKDSAELIKLYILHKYIASLINNGEYDFAFVHPSKFTQAPFILRFLKGKSIYYAPETLRLIYDEFFFLQANLPTPKKLYESINRFIRKFIDRQNILQADIVLANSEFTKKNIEKAYKIKPFVCYPGVDDNKYKPENLKKVYDLFFLGEKTDFDGFNILSKTLKLFTKKIIVKYLDRENNPITEQQLIQEYCKSKIALAFSRNEPFGLGTIEAMSCGVPVIAIDEGGFKETIINNKTGVLVKDDGKTIKEKIDFFLENEKIRNKFGEDARECVLRNFTWKKSVENFLDIVDRNL